MASRGGAWRTQDFLGCSPHGLSSFLPYPSTLSADTDILKRMTVDDLEKGVDVPLKKEGIRGFRWRGAKPAMVTSDRCARHPTPGGAA